MGRLTCGGVLVALAAAIVGCQPSAPVQMGHDILPAPENVISTQQLAYRLGLAVDADSGAVVSLRNADLFVSIHADSAANRAARGFTVYVCRGASADSHATAKAVIQSQDSGSGLNSRGVRAANYRVLVQTQCPAILVELGYLSNRQEAMMLRQDAVRKKLARCVAEGIDSFLRQP